jgi:hypothetical protein
MKECTKFSEDSAKVNAQEMAFDEFKSNLIDGKYYERQENGFCSQLVIDSADMANVRDMNGIPRDKIRRPKIRKLTVDGGFSSITKLYIKPSIPFKYSFNGESIDVTVMTLFHPCPLRVENVQYDAVLTLGDVGDRATKTVMLIPLQGSIAPGSSGTFFSRIVSYMPGILRPNPATGLYESIDAPTGRDWNLSMVFPGAPSGGETLVKSGYYAWYGTPPLEEYVKNQVTRPAPWADTIEYGWRPRTGETTRFIMLAKPISISTFDLQTIKMLPATPAEDAMPLCIQIPSCTVPPPNARTSQLPPPRRRFGKEWKIRPLAIPLHRFSPLHD